MYGRLGSFFLAQYLADIDAQSSNKRWPDHGPVDQNAGILLKWFMVAGIACSTLIVLALIF